MPTKIRAIALDSELQDTLKLPLYVTTKSLLCQALKSSQTLTYFLFIYKENQTMTFRLV